MMFFVLHLLYSLHMMTKSINKDIPHKDIPGLKNGFTLLEVIIAMVILSLALMGIAGLMITTINTNKTGINMSTAVLLAQNKIEEARRLGYFGVGNIGTTTLEAYQTIIDYPSFQRETLVTGVSGISEAKVVTVSVYWNFQGEHFVTLKTILIK